MLSILPETHKGLIQPLMGFWSYLHCIRLACEQVLISQANLMHDIHTNTAPSKIVNLFSQTSSIHTYNTRSSSKKNMYIKKFNLENQAVAIFGAN